MKHIYFSGIGGTGIGPLALIAHQAGYTVSGSDKQASGYIDYLKAQGIENIHIGQTKEAMDDVNAQQPIDWLVYSSAVSIEDPNHPELAFAKENNIPFAATNIPRRYASVVSKGGFEALDTPV